MSSERFPTLVLFILGAVAAGVIGSSATYASVAEWYPTLQKPGWTPPNWLFGPVWSFLYMAMAVSAWLAWRKAKPRQPILWLYVAQLVLNAGWSVLFFGLRQPAIALIEVIVFWLLLVVILVRHARIDRLSGWLWAPYVVWVAYATALNAAIVVLN
ncbi:TspO/MBR family protein [Opitutus sp. ER46]|uniref:TspO/MBR family protein n=1 Tax=Opitutus sp. ER46 TaxID=2161864 RepID=UPI000D308B0E|nr:TspO/MBR family protein [Opitutus sp. ER46]PTX95691.1 sensory protein TspO [Opitutus sp. ER46]